MKLSILPSFNLKADAEELGYKHNSFYRGNNRKLSFLLNHALYFVAFFIPLITLLFFMSHFGYTPFGDNCMFTLDGAYRNLPVLTSIVHDIQEGNFHIFSLKGSVGSELYSSIAYYLASPFTLICLFFNQETAVSLMSLFAVFRIACSGPVMFHYLTHRPGVKSDSLYNPMLLIFSLGYSLSSYALVQYNDFMFLDHFMLFPLLMLYLEHFTKNGTCRKKFVILNVYLLFSNFYLGIILNLFAIVFYFFWNENKVHAAIRRFIRLLGMIFLSCSLSAVTVIPGLYKFVQNCHTPSAALGSAFLQADPFYFFLNHLFWGTPSYLRIATSGVNLYFGLFVFILVFLYFFNRGIAPKRRLATLLTLSVLIFSLCNEQLSYFFHLFSVNGTSFTCYAFVYVFFLLITASEVLPYLRSFSLKYLVLAIIIPVIMTLLSINFTNTVPGYDSAYYSLTLIVVYAVLLLLYRIGSIKRDSFYSLILCISCLEILANGFQLSFLVSQSRTTMADIIITDGPTVADSTDFTRSEYFSDVEYAYQSNLASRYSFNPLLTQSNFPSTHTPLEDALARISYVYMDKSSDAPKTPLSSQYRKIPGTDTHDIYENSLLFPGAFSLTGSLNEDNIDTSTFITRQNSIGKALGSSADIYVEDTDLSTKLTMEKDSEISCYPMGNNMYAVENIPDELLLTNVTPTLQFTPSQDGELFLVIRNQIAYLGNVTAGKKYEYSFNITSIPQFDTVIWVQAFYYNSDVMKQLHSSLSAASCPISYKDSDTVEIQADVSEDSTILTMLPYNPDATITTGDGNTLTGFSYHDQLAFAVPAGSSTIQITYRFPPFIWGIIISILTLALCCLYRFYATLAQRIFLPVFALGKIYFDKILLWAKENRIYLLAFTLPFGAYLFIMIINGCMPFGPFCIFNGDGIEMALPMISYYSYMLQGGFPGHSWYGGNGFNTATTIQLSLMELIYGLIPESQIFVFASFYTIIILCLSGPSIVYYLTHRTFGRKAYKKDYRLLIPAMCYTLCNYMVCIINNPTWYTVLTLFPLILLGMDYLMDRNKCRYYVFALGFALLCQYYVTMFICFYLVIRFFTYRFNNFKDFLKKGIRFALSSLFTGGLSFYALYFGMTGLQMTEYAKDDAIFPSSYLFNGFHFLFNRLSIFSDSYLTSWNEGDANLYFGILPLLLLVIYTLAKKIPLKEKLKTLVPYGIFFFSLNYSVFNYILNGFHYQHGVPNRFVFILVIMTSFISYDCIRVLSRIPRKNVVLSGIVLILLFTGSYMLTSQNERNLRAYIATIVCLGIYCVILCKPSKKQLPPRKMTTYITALFCLEIFINAAVQVPNHTGGTYYLDYAKNIQSYINKTLNMEESLDHVSMLPAITTNYPLIGHTKGNPLFSIALTAEQINLARYSGCYASSNVLSSTNNPTPIGNAVGNVRYIMIPDTTYAKNILDLANYTPFALYNDSIILENKRYFPFGYYLPDSISPGLNTTMATTNMWNFLSDAVLVDDTPIVQSSILYNSSSDEVANATDTNVNYFTTSPNQQVDTNYDFHLHGTIPYTGSVYVYLSDYPYIGEYKKGDILNHTVDGRNLRFESTDEDTTLEIIDNDRLTALCEKVNEHPFEVTSFTDDSLSGTIDMPEDGYINFTMPYDEFWHIEIDGKAVKAQSLGNGFLTLEADKGFHEVTMTYKDNRRFPTIAITAFCWILFFAGCFVKDRFSNRIKR